MPIITSDKGYAGIFGSPIGGIRAKLSDDTKLTIRSHILNGKWLPEISSRNNSIIGYSGIKNKNIDAIMIKAENHKISYRVYTDKWYPWVTGYSTKDFENGYAGTFGEKITAIQIKLLD